MAIDKNLYVKIVDKLKDNSIPKDNDNGYRATKVALRFRPAISLIYIGAMTPVPPTEVPPRNRAMYKNQTLCPTDISIQDSKIGPAWNKAVARRPNFSARKPARNAPGTDPTAISETTHDPEMVIDMFVLNKRYEF